MVWQQIKDYEEEQHMTYITTAERIGIKQGKADGLAEASRNISLLLAEKRFGPLSEVIRMRITALSPAQLTNLIVALLDFQSLEDLVAWLDSAS